MTIEITMTDLWREDFGWSANGCWVERATIEVADDASDLSIARAVMRELGASGFRRDGWCCSDFCWRSGCVGIWADIVS